MRASIDRSLVPAAMAPGTNCRQQLALLMAVVFLALPAAVEPRVAKFLASVKAATSLQQARYAVIFDAGSSGSRVHVFGFDENLKLIKLGADEVEVYEAIKPGLSAYAEDPAAAAASLQPLVSIAEASVPSSQQSVTPVLLGATAGLRLLPGSQAQDILDEVSVLFDNSTFLTKPEWVSVLDGIQEGSYMWTAVNYLLNKVGNSFDETVGIVDMGGGSVQMAYAISDSDAANAPTSNTSYIRKLTLAGKPYNLYVHSYLSYGLLAARAEILKQVPPAHYCLCLPKGFPSQNYSYGDEGFPAIASPNGGDYESCKNLATGALKVDASCETCSLGGVWRGPEGAGLNSLYVASYFWDVAVETGIVTDEDAGQATVTPGVFEEMAKKVCGLNVTELATMFPDYDAGYYHYFCMDLSFQYSLLVEGFRLEPTMNFTLVTKLKYHEEDLFVGTAWPLGSAIELLSLT